MECPRCGQGPIELVRFGRFAITVQKCAECDAVWPEKAEVDKRTFVQFQTLLDILGESEGTLEHYEVLSH